MLQAKPMSAQNAEKPCQAKCTYLEQADQESCMEQAENQLLVGSVNATISFISILMGGFAVVRNDSRSTSLSLR